MRQQKRKSNAPIVIICIVLILAIAATLFWAMGGLDLLLGKEDTSPPVSSSSASVVSPVSQSAPATSAADLPDEMRAMWISFLEWDKYDISTEENMRQVAGQMFGNCANMGLNTVIVHVRAFSDAMYKSDYFPWSHLITGTQGQDPGYDPLAVIIEEAHSRNLRIEAFINPYRAHHSLYKDLPLAENNPAAQHPDWVRTLEDGSMWYDPGIPEVQQLVVDGVKELAQNYALDGIQFDDYFYQGNGEEFDAETYATYGGGASLADWRRGNVNTLVRDVYAAIKSVKPTLAFGISPAGNNDNNYSMYYADIKMWMSEPGYIDYIMPQLYWGFGHQMTDGSTRFAFDKVATEWASFPRYDGLQLYAGLAAYNIGTPQADGTRSGLTGNGANEDQSEWESGHAMADQVTYLRSVGFSGFALFRYDFLYQENDPVSAQEVESLTKLLAA